MRALALLMCLLAIALLMVVVNMDAPARPEQGVFVQVERSLLAIAPALPRQPANSQPPSLAPAGEMKPVSVIVCSRLGVFPRASWAEHVAVILTTDAVPGAAALERGSLPIKETAARSWQVQKIGPNAYYLRFDAWDIDELAARMTRQRVLLKRLLSINAIPEAC